jgi:hypothetical protein
MAAPPETQLERAKQMIDYVKQITTLSTGSILLLATFLEKLFLKPSWKPLIVISFAGFVVSVIAAVFLHTVFVDDEKLYVTGDLESRSWEKAAAISLIFMWSGFLVGILSLAIFAVRNLV